MLSHGSADFFATIPNASAIDDDFKNLPWLKSETFLGNENWPRQVFSLGVSTEFNSYSAIRASHQSKRPD